MSTEQNKAVLHRYFEAQNRHSLDDAFAFFSPNILSHSVPGSDSAVGIDDIKAFFTDFHDAVPDFQVTLHDMIAERDKVVVRFTVTGTQTKELMGQPPGQPFVEHSLTMYRLENGKIAEVWS
ncbi:MAG: ester cyclase [Anaerolineae bacterium]|nr:ester cyclase [Anaerolineae bacterium]